VQVGDMIRESKNSGIGIVIEVEDRMFRVYWLREPSFGSRDRWLWIDGDYEITKKAIKKLDKQ
jgi:hypothetical protein